MLFLFLGCGFLNHLTFPRDQQYHRWAIDGHIFPQKITSRKIFVFTWIDFVKGSCSSLCSDCHVTWYIGSSIFCRKWQGLSISLTYEPPTARNAHYYHLGQSQITKLSQMMLKMAATFVTLGIRFFSENSSDKLYFGIKYNCKQCNISLV